MKIHKLLRQNNESNTVECRTLDGMHLPSDDGMIRINKGSLVYAFPGLLVGDGVYVYFPTANMVAPIEFEFLKVNGESVKHIDHRSTAKKMYEETMEKHSKFQAFLNRISQSNDQMTASAVMATIKGISEHRQMDAETYRGMMMIGSKIQEDGLDPDGLYSTMISSYYTGRQELNKKAALSMVEEKRLDQPRPTLEDMTGLLENEEFKQFASNRDNIELGMGSIVLELIAWMSRDGVKEFTIESLIVMLKEKRSELWDVASGKKEKVQENLQIGVDRLVKDDLISKGNTSYIVLEGCVDVALQVLLSKEGLA